jgi:phage terminase large subunit-like protein
MAFDAVSGAEWEERPVTIEEFVTSEDYLKLPPLSHYQYQIIRAGTQIYRKETLIALYGEEEGLKRFSETCFEVILQLGKGSGKDYCSTIIISYIVYLLLCLKDPAKYYGLPEDTTIDILNIAVNADQARNVYFVQLKKRIQRCEWFEDKIENITQNSIEFKKSVRVFSGHSEREAFEGLNLFAAVLDEISAFALESNTGNTLANTAEAVYKMYRASVVSRHPDFGKLIMLSFPRFKDDFIQQRYNKVVAEKEVITRTHTMKLDPDLPDGIEGNEFEVSWEEDNITKYTFPHIFALKRPTWEINPTVRIDSPAMVREAAEDPGDFLGRFACMPSHLTDGFFKNRDAIDAAFVTMNGVDEDGTFLERFQPKEGVKYFIHVDLAQKHDYCAVALAHVDSWVNVSVGSNFKEIHPVVQVDAIRYWKPTKTKSVDFADVRDYIIALRRRGFDIKLCTFDRWNSHDTMNILTHEHGIPTEILSVDKKHYDDFLSVMYDKRLVGPKVDLLIEELKELRQVQKATKVIIDHPRKGSKDLSDAVCGAIFDAVEGTPRPVNLEVEVLTLRDLHKREQDAMLTKAAKDMGLPNKEALISKHFDGIIRSPERPKAMPDDLAQFIGAARIL